MHSVRLIKCAMKKSGKSFCSTSKKKVYDNPLVRSQALVMLAQHTTILNMISCDDYTKKCSKYFDASIGGHIRHSLDHFQRVVHFDEKPFNKEPENTSNILINYDERQRDTLIQTDKKAALEAVRIMVVKIPNLKLENEISVSFMGNEKTFESYQMKSSIERELSFASHHSIHHLATIKFMMSDLGYQFEKDSPIGIATSTIQCNQEHHKL